MVTYASALFYGVGGTVVAFVALVALLVIFQDKLIYRPALRGVTSYYPITPAWHDLIYDEVWFWSSDGILLHSWFIKMSPECRGPTILFFQENAGTTNVSDFSFNNVAHRLEKVRIMMQNLKCNIFMLSYRGYGQSGGYPSEHGIIKDAQAALDHLSQRTDIDTSRIVVFGRSLGGAIGAVLAKNNPEKVSALILENTFTSILDMAGVLLPFLKLFIGGSGSKSLKLLNSFVRSPWNTIDVIGEVKQPVLFLSGMKDEIVPPSHMKMLYEKAAARNSQCTFVEFPYVKHGNTWAFGVVYWNAVMQFLVEHAPEGRKHDTATAAHIKCPSCGKELDPEMFYSTSL